MVHDFVLSYAKMIVRHPDAVSIETASLDESAEEITIYADPEDVGKLIGKEGRMINASRQSSPAVRQKAVKIIASM
jgi:predicted RNA-binding protein YlqC (UPF0109 family)